MKNKKNQLFFFSLFLVFSFLFFPGNHLLAENSITKGFQLIKDSDTGLNEANTLQAVIGNLLLWLLGSLAVLAVLGFVGSGILYITSGGGEQKELAKKWIRYTIIGLVVALSAYGIVYTVDQIFKY